MAPSAVRKAAHDGILVPVGARLPMPVDGPPPTPPVPVRAPEVPPLVPPVVPPVVPLVPPVVLVPGAGVASTPVQPPAGQSRLAQTSNGVPPAPTVRAEVTQPVPSTAGPWLWPVATFASGSQASPMPSLSVSFWLSGPISFF